MQACAMTVLPGLAEDSDHLIVQVPLSCLLLPVLTGHSYDQEKNGGHR